MNKKLNDEIFKENLRQKKLKELELMREKVADKKMVDQIIEKERQMALLEEQEKERHKQETINYLKNFKNRSNELKMNQDYLDKLLQEEQEKQWRKQQSQWDKEEKARINLLYDVYGNRAKAVEFKQKQRQEELRQKELEKMKLTSDIQSFKTKEREKELDEILVTIYKGIFDFF